MKQIFYTSPFVPAEWIAAHGLSPVRMTAGSSMGADIPVIEGMCPYAQAFVETVVSDTSADAVIVTTTCDQMRRASDLLSRKCDKPLFVMNIPYTWTTPGPIGLYRSELERLSGFLVKIGGKTPVETELAGIMRRYDDARKSVRETQRCSSSLLYRTAVDRFHMTGGFNPEPADSGSGGGIPLIVLGGPVPSSEYWFFDAVEKCGGRVVADGTENGVRGMPGSFDRERLGHDPVQELVNAYFTSIPDVFQRPNSRLYRWLEREILTTKARGIIIRHYVWCDLWKAEARRIAKLSPVPVLHFDVESSAPSRQRTLNRIQAFMELLHER